jgi:Bacterial lipocalin
MKEIVIHIKKYIRITIFFSFLLPLVLYSHQQPLTTTPRQVDIRRYMGSWYEIARLPMFFQRGCICSTAHYSLKKQYVRVTNECVKYGRISIAKGKAYIVPDSRNTKLKIQFFWPFKGDYWILYLDKQYQNVLVGSPDRRFLWLLSRKPSIPKSLLNKLLIIAKHKGFNIKKLIISNRKCNIKIIN